MNDWTSGYVADIGYTFGYYGELNPARIKLAFLNAGLAFPEVGTACELGFGQGVSVNFHAAATMTQWSGTDFNPSQAANAQEMANIAGAGAKLFDEAFSEFINREDLPDFDFIALHGIWSWISDGNRKCLVEFFRRKLKVGGVLYISYNTLPGWAYFAPMRHLMTEHAEIIGAEGRGIVSRINDALEFAEKLLATKPNFLKASPLAADRLKQIKAQNRHYLAHEYFNRDWHPMHFSTMADWLESAKVQYACSAQYTDHVEAINLTSEQQQFLKEIPDAMFRESVRDFMVNQQFRKDYWVKGARRISSLEQVEQARQIRVILVSHRPDVSLKISGSLGVADMSEGVYTPLLDELADYKPHTVAQLETHLRDKNVNFAQLMQALMLLCGTGHLFIVQDDPVVAKVKKRTDKMNAYLMTKARSGNDHSYLVSPVTGGGHLVDRFQQIFLLAVNNGEKQPVEWARYAWRVLEAQKQKLIKDGKAIETAEGNLEELTQRAVAFQTKYLPILRALQIT